MFIAPPNCDESINITTTDGPPTTTTTVEPITTTSTPEPNTESTTLSTSESTTETTTETTTDKANRRNRPGKQRKRPNLENIIARASISGYKQCYNISLCLN